MKTTFPVSAPPGAWAALADPERLAAALPGCRSVTRDAGGGGTLHVVTEVAVASVRGVWAGTVAPVDGDAVHVRGSGAPGAVDLLVRADPGRTSITVEGSVDGALGTVGAAVLAGAVKRMAKDLLSAAEHSGTGQSSRGHGSHQGEPAISIATGARGSGRAADGPRSSGVSGGRRVARGVGAALVGALVALLVRRRARGRAG